MDHYSVGINELSDAFKDVLEKYDKDVLDALNEATKKQARETKRDIVNNIGHSGIHTGTRDGKYAKNWAVKNEGTGLTVKSTIYNKAPTYRLVHLLEKGHQTKAWGKVISGHDAKAYPHVAPAAKKAGENYVKKIEEEINDIH